MYPRLQNNISLVLWQKISVRRRWVAVLLTHEVWNLDRGQPCNIRTFYRNAFSRSPYSPKATELFADLAKAIVTASVSSCYSFHRLPTAVARLARTVSRDSGGSPELEILRQYYPRLVWRKRMIRGGKKRRVWSPRLLAEKDESSERAGAPALRAEAGWQGLFVRLWREECLWGKLNLTRPEGAQYPGCMRTQYPSLLRHHYMERIA